jgi:hypothetical protein
MTRTRWDCPATCQSAKSGAVCRTVHLEGRHPDGISPPVNAAGGLSRNNQFVIKSAFPRAALAVSFEAVAMRVGGGGRHRGECTGEKGEQDGENDEALHVAFPFRRQLTASTCGRPVTRTVTPTMRPAEPHRILHLDEAAKDPVVALGRFTMLEGSYYRIPTRARTPEKQAAQALVRSAN